VKSWTSSLWILFLLLFLVGTVAGAYASTPSKATVKVNVFDRANVPSNGTVLQVITANGVQIQEQPVNGTATFNLSKGYYEFRSIRFYPWLGEYITGKANLTISDTTKSYQVKVNETNLYFLQLKTFNLDDGRFLDNSTIRVEICAEIVDRANHELYWHPLGISKALTFNYIYQQDGSINQSIYQNYGVKARDHAFSYEKYPNTKDQRLYVKEGYFYFAEPLPVGNYVIKIWDNVHLLSKGSINLTQDTMYRRLGELHATNIPNVYGSCFRCV